MHFKDTTYRGVRMLSLCGAFMGLLTDFPILVCDLASGTIIGTDVLPHTLDTRNGLLFTEGAPRYSCTVGMQRSPAAFSQLATAPFPLIQRMYYIVPFILLADVLFPLVGCWRTSPFSHKTMVVVGRTLADPSWWSVLVLVSNFSQDTVMVEPFSEVGMLTQISTIQSVTETMASLHAVLSRFPCTFVTSWIRRLGTWTRYNDVNWRASSFDIQICSPFQINIDWSH